MNKRFLFAVGLLALQSFGLQAVGFNRANFLEMADVYFRDSQSGNLDFEKGRILEAAKLSKLFQPEGADQTPEAYDEACQAVFDGYMGQGGSGHQWLFDFMGEIHRRAADKLSEEKYQATVAARLFRDDAAAVCGRVFETQVDEKDGGKRGLEPAVGKNRMRAAVVCVIWPCIGAVDAARLEVEANEAGEGFQWPQLRCSRRIPFGHNFDLQAQDDTPKFLKTSYLAAAEAAQLLVDLRPNQRVTVLRDFQLRNFGGSEPGVSVVKKLVGPGGQKFEVDATGAKCVMVVQECDDGFEVKEIEVCAANESGISGAATQSARGFTDDEKRPFVDWLTDARKKELEDNPWRGPGDEIAPVTDADVGRLVAHHMTALTGRVTITFPDVKTLGGGGTPLHATLEAGARVTGGLGRIFRQAYGEKFSDDLVGNPRGGRPMLEAPPEASGASSSSGSGAGSGGAAPAMDLDPEDDEGEGAPGSRVASSVYPQHVAFGPPRHRGDCSFPGFRCPLHSAEFLQWQTGDNHSRWRDDEPEKRMGIECEEAMAVSTIRSRFDREQVWLEKANKSVERVRKGAFDDTWTGKSESKIEEEVKGWWVREAAGVNPRVMASCNPEEVHNGLMTKQEAEDTWQRLKVEEGLSGFRLGAAAYLYEAGCYCEPWRYVDQRFPGSYKPVEITDNDALGNGDEAAKRKVVEHHIGHYEGFMRGNLQKYIRLLDPLVGNNDMVFIQCSRLIKNAFYLMFLEMRKFGLWKTFIRKAPFVDLTPLLVILPTELKIILKDAGFGEIADKIESPLFPLPQASAEESPGT